MAETFDAIIIGGGVMGASIALHLARRGLGRIILLEREALCAGSTGSSVASVDLLTQHPLMAALQVRSLYAFQHCAELYGDQCGWVQTGFAILGGEDARDGVREVMRVIGEAGGKIELLCRDDYRHLDPACVPDDAPVISWAPHGGYLDPVMLTNTFTNAARQLGVKVRQYEPATKLLHQGDRVTGVRSKSGEIAAATVVVAAGPWCADFLRPAEIDLPLQAQRHSVALLACPAEASPRTSVFDAINLVYARPETGGLTVCGSLDLTMGYDNIHTGDECGTPPMAYGMWVWERLVARYP
ncbi:MAG: FAD-binding oxidoreductase, partial [Chloroflexi bacterium]|nr:FAD-binding oxidoreductase [Chloroflexota bacterium]